MDPQLTESRQDLFLDLAGHAGLLGAGMLRRVRVRVGREGAVLARSLVEAEPLANAIVQLTEATTGWFGFARLQGSEVALLRGQQELRHHVPIHRAESFETEHGPGTAGERLVVKDLFVQREERLPQDANAIPDVDLELFESRTKLVGVLQVGVEPVLPLRILDDDPAPPDFEKRLDLRDG